MLQQNRNIVYIVLGMHKSGTTLVSRLLMDAGVHMGDFDLNRDYDSGNQLEREETRLINKKILGCGDAFSLEIQAPLKPSFFSEEVLGEGSKLAASLQRKHPVWGFKDPRTCLTYTYWEKILPVHRLIMVYRHPEEVISHYFRKRFSPTAIPKISKAFQCWTLYNQNMLDVLKRREDALLLNFSLLMQNSAELQRLERFLGHRVVDRREPQKYRSKRGKTLYYNSALLYSLIIRGENPLRLFNTLESYRTKQAQQMDG
ncbi:sulfotransferase [Desulfonatronospira sp.]|uniref:sulfotransferase n=1 Tax=Desulfonatronospira sp. TaxID=1962951 RepID=UPI0025BAE7C2|nr:sulfotransferase [Desulfonatronospira sp.]